VQIRRNKLGETDSTLRPVGLANEPRVGLDAIAEIWGEVSLGGMLLGVKGIDLDGLEVSRPGSVCDGAQKGRRLSYCSPVYDGVTVLYSLDGIFWRGQLLSVFCIMNAHTISLLVGDPFIQS
jgi:hypothetical protein